MYLKNPIKSLSIITSCGCNLACKYCVIAQTTNKNSAKIQQATIQALQDGSFLENCINVLNRLNQSPGRIEQIDLWGQEPTLTLPYITEHIEDWMKAFPCLKGMFFSTNGVAYADRIIDFILALDKAVSHPMAFKLQVSYDGDLSTATLREAKPYQIQQNIISIVEALNHHKLNNITVSISFNAVCSLDLVRELKSFDDVLTYYQNMHNWVQPIYNASFNKNVEVNPFVITSPEIPVDASTEDGLMMANFYRRTLRINPNILDSRAIGSLTSQVARSMELIHNLMPEASIMELLEKMAYDQNLYRYILDFLSHSIYCGAYFGELKIMYDGTCVLCQNNIFETDLESIPQDKNIETNVRRNFVKHKIILNPLKETDEIIERTFNLFHEAKNSSFYFIMSNHLALMQLLVDSHQIDSSYENEVKQMVHAFVLTCISGCGYNNYIKTGSLFCKDTGFIRYYCNGLLDEMITLNPGWKGERKIYD